MAEKIGITCAGNWIVDRVKTCDRLVGRGMLANIHSEKMSSGGSPANVLGCLSRLGTPFPLAGIGVVGNDDAGRYLLKKFKEMDVDTTGIAVTTEAATSYTDVMNEETTGDRTFYHYRGANALFGPEHVLFDKLTCSIFHLGYLLLLDTMDMPHPACGTVAASVLKKIQALGIKTSLDVVSEESDRFGKIVPPALAYVDYLILNEIEASRITGIQVRDPAGALISKGLQEAVEKLSHLGSLLIIAVHMPEGVYVREKSGRTFSSGSLQLPEGFIKGAVGAGDAFCAGMLYGLHEKWKTEKCALLGTCAAAACLSHENATDGIIPLAETLALARKYPLRASPVVL